MHKCTRDDGREICWGTMEEKHDGVFGHDYQGDGEHAVESKIATAVQKAWAGKARETRLRTLRRCH